MAASPMAAAVQQLTKELDACKRRIKKIERENEKLRSLLAAAQMSHPNTPPQQRHPEDGAVGAVTSTGETGARTTICEPSLATFDSPTLGGAGNGGGFTATPQSQSIQSEEAVHHEPSFGSPSGGVHSPDTSSQSARANMTEIDVPLVRFDSFGSHHHHTRLSAHHLRSRSYDPLAATGALGASMTLGTSMNVGALRRRIEAFEEREECWKEQVTTIAKDMETLRREHRREVSVLQEQVDALTEQLLQSKLEHPSSTGAEEKNKNAGLALSPSDALSVSGIGSASEVDVDRSVRLRQRSKSMVVLKKKPAGPDGKGVLIAELSKADLDEDIFVTHSNHVRTISNNLVPFSAASLSAAAANASGGSNASHSAPMLSPSGYSITNPNQLGETMGDGSKNKQWYLHTVLKLALQKVISNDKTTRGVFSDQSQGATSITLQGKSMSCINMMVKESCELHYFIKDNCVVQSDVEVTNLPAFHKQNSDVTLLQNFSSSSTGTTTMEAASAGSRDGDRVFPRLNARCDQVRVVFSGLMLFSYIRTFLHFDVDLFLHTIEEAVWRESTSPGKSDASMFFFGHYVLKSVKESEYRFLKDSYVGMFARYAEMNPHTLISKFFSLFSVYNVKKGTRQNFVVMNNVFWTKHYINRIFDIKGSSAGRDVDAHVGARTAFGALLLKDNDLPSQLIICGPMKRATLLAQLRSDTSFLASLSIVDYSCIIGIRTRLFTRDQRHQQLRAHQQQQAFTGDADELLFSFTAADGGILSLPIYAENDTTTVREDTYYIGLIDVLQTYTAQKRLEHFAKGLLRDKHTISVVPPGEFSERLCRVLERITV
jgi:hypothetical protein